MWLCNSTIVTWEKLENTIKTNSWTEIHTSYQQGRLRELLDNWILTQNKRNELLELWFSIEQILENTIKLKHLTELYDNNKKIEIVSFKKLKNIVSSYKNLEEIKENLKQIINLEEYDLWTQVLIMSILD